MRGGAERETHTYIYIEEACMEFSETKLRHYIIIFHIRGKRTLVNSYQVLSRGHVL